ncbi:MAG: hypothetical protein DMF00_12980 [Verrucomicrobia bacterium]|nr:MAG: hypothetical protein DMF00_12980 [Verrucomicrobiota bacterium]
MLPVHGLKRAVKEMRWRFHFGEFSVSKQPLLEARQRCRAFSLFSMHGDNGKRYALCAEEKLRAFVELESVRDKPNWQ